jgi:hypothetical protein
MRVSAKNKEVPQVTMVLNLHVTKITHTNWFRSSGGGSYIFSNVWKSGGLTPHFLPKTYGNYGGVAPQNEACMREMYSL